MTSSIEAFVSSSEIKTSLFWWWYDDLGGYSDSQCMTEKAWESAGK